MFTPPIQQFYVAKYYANKNLFDYYDHLIDHLTDLTNI